MIRLAPLLLLPLLASGAEETPASLSKEAVKAYGAKDYARFLALERRALALEPTDARVLYNVACGEALTGARAKAVRDLEALLSRKLDLGAEGDADFTGVRGTPEWARYEGELKALRAPLVRSVRAFEVGDSTLLLTGIAVDPKTGDVYMGSTRRKKIIRRTRDGRVSDFTQEGQDGLLSVASLLIDPQRRLLFASTAPAPHMLGFPAGAEADAGVLAFDLGTGHLVRKALLAPDSRKHFLNALAMDRAGNVYVSDSLEPGIYRFANDSNTLEKVLPDGLFAATQGLAFLGDDDRILYVADWTDGVWAYDLSARTRRKIVAPPDAWLSGLDGLTPVRGGFLSVQIGVQPARVLYLRLDEKADRIQSVEILEMSHPDYEGPIQGALDQDSFVYVANSQLDLVDPKTGAFAAEKARPPIVLRLPLPR